MPKPTSDCRATGRKHLWPMVRLGDVCTIEFGTRVRRKDSQGGDYPVYGGGGATFCWSTYNREDQCIVSRFAMSEECVRFVKGKFFLNDSGLSVRSDNQDLSQTYLDWVLYSKQPEIYALGRGAAQKNLDVEQFVDMMLPLPPLSVQREIVARLERELAAVEKMKKGTARADYVAECRVIFERIAQEHPKVSLDDACEFIKDGTHQTPTYTDDIYRGYKFLSSKDVVTGEIDWSKSQIRTFQYAPWNGKRHTYEADRCGIEKGSVFVVKSNGASCPETSRYVGFYVNEGFGKVIYNPFFLAGNSNEQGRALITLAEKEQKVLPTPNSPNPHSPLIAFLENKKQTVESNQTVYQIVQDEVKILDPYFKKGKFASQWGSIRSLAMITPDSQQLITAIDAFLSHGVAKDKWEEQNRKGRLDDFMANHEREDLQSIMINLASEMAKKCKAREEDK